MKVSGCHGVWTCKGQWPIDWAGGWVGFMVHLDYARCSEPHDTDDLFLPQTLFPLVPAPYRLQPLYGVLTFVFISQFLNSPLLSHL